jgi:EAL domain-containing protein (putative c-di-GMP-specific phosphodiesterase class I)
VQPVSLAKGVAMQGGKKWIDPMKPDASPLGVAISEGDRQTIAMVQSALRQGRLGLAYQPIVMTRDTSRIGFYEGLIRVLDPSGRIIPAKDFMDAVESHEIGRLIDCASLRMGLQALATHPGLRLSINMSARSVGYPRWTAILTEGLAVSPTIAERLILEITESSAMLVPELVVRFMQDLQSRGIAFALDDFGAGYTAFRYFRDFAFDILKVDGMFTRGIENDPDNQALVRALVSVGKHFHMLTVAEMVETAAEAECLRTIGLDCLQGYAFGMPTMKPTFMQAKLLRA